MEFTKDITFGGELKANEPAKITYSGDLYKKGSDFVAIVYGFGENWEHTTEKAMDKTEGGFTTEVEMKDNFDTFNFCFRNGGYEWDNNQTFNYISAIGPAVTEVAVTTEEVGTEIEELSEVTETGFNSDLIIEILDNLLEENLNKISSIGDTETDTDKQQILEDILSENVTPVATPILTQEFDMDQLVENILNPVINCATFEEETEEDLTSTVFAETEEGIVGGDTKDTTGIETGLITTPENNYLVSPRKLRKFYLVTKKIKLAIYKLVVAIPKLLSGTFDENNN